MTIKPGGPDIVPEQVVLGNQAEFGINWLDNTLATRDQGGEIVNIAQVFARSGMTEITWADSGLDDDRPTSRARRSASGSAATSTSSSPR